MKKILFIIPIIILSCNTIEDLEVLNFDNFKVLKGEEIILEDNISSITSDNNRIITFNNNTKSNFISVYNDSTYQIEYRGAAYGKGDNEFLSALYMNYTSICNDNKSMSFLILDNIKSKYHMINIDKSIKENKCVIDFSADCDNNNAIHRILNDTLALCLNVENTIYYLFNYIANTPLDSLVISEKKQIKRIVIAYQIPVFII